MKNESALISTSILTTIWDETHQDNIELIIPFIKYLIHKNFKIDECIDKSKIMAQLNKEFSFNNFPHAVLDVILNRMKKRKILKKENKQFYLEQDLTKEYSSFEARLLDAKQNTNYILQSLHEYLKDEFPKITLRETESGLINFMEEYGYKIYRNVNDTKTINIKSNFVNYCIGEFIQKESKQDSVAFNSMLKIIEGNLIANAIYLQIENDNKASLKILNCYLDTSFLLRVLGFKTNEENLSASELFRLLKEYKANIKCFTHTFQEVKNVMIYYKNHIGTLQNSTLEYFDLKGYTETQVDMAINNLENRFKEFNIEIVDTPDYTEDKFKSIIDVKALTEKLKEHSKQKKISYNNDNAIQNDIKSVCSINMFRNGKPCSKIENCSHIFVTTYQYLKQATKEVMPELTQLNLGLVIDDLDLTTILWLKNFSADSNLPKLRLIENAIAATNPNPQIIEKMSKYLEDIKRDKLIPGVENVSQILTTNYLKSNEYIKEVKNDPNNVTKQNLEDYLKRKDNEITRVQNELNDTKERNIKREIELATIKQNLFDEAEKIANAKNKKLKLFLKILYYVMLAIIISFGICISLKSYDIKNFNIGFIIGMLFTIVSILDSVLPRAKYVSKLIDRVCKKYKNSVLEEETQKAIKLCNQT